MTASTRQLRASLLGGRVVVVLLLSRQTSRALPQRHSLEGRSERSRTLPLSSPFILSVIMTAFSPPRSTLRSCRTCCLYRTHGKLVSLEARTINLLGAVPSVTLSVARCLVLGLGTLRLTARARLPRLAHRRSPTRWLRQTPLSSSGCILASRQQQPVARGLVRVRVPSRLRTPELIVTSWARALTLRTLLLICRIKKLSLRKDPLQNPLLNIESFRRSVLTTSVLSSRASIIKTFINPRVSGKLRNRSPTWWNTGLFHLF